MFAHITESLENNTLTEDPHTYDEFMDEWLT